ncbi:cytochrome P450 [Fomitiporia mediterranea MF3/22]|uniref:cytochrome P450 n=1 Tax=Fomitiporia mediterranea (strain MF3/22) TaxID=694068 RepID=UPI0004409184|nr:cytochrome P450 [Fomitiporia mediterranea MF3/22]EJD07458.1 cytochrome P450 [Fomitiporia mediterranea MF3/22]
MNFSPDVRPLLVQMNSALKLAKVEDHVQYYTLLMAVMCIAVVSLSRFFKSGKSEDPLEFSHRMSTHTISSQIPSPYSSGRTRRHYDHGTFKIPEMNRNTIIINRRDLIEEIRKAPDSTASFDEAVAVDFALRWTFGLKLTRNPYHLTTVRNQLTRSLGVLFDDIRDEIVHAFNDLIPTKNDGMKAVLIDTQAAVNNMALVLDWVAILALDTVRSLVCRASNRIFVGVPLCRDPVYTDLSTNFTVDIMKTVYMMNDTPAVLHPIIAALFNPTARSVRQAMKLLRPILEERFRMYDENGDDWPGKPVDMISWLIDEAPNNEKRSVRELTLRLLSVNFTAIHTSSNSFTHALLHLAAEPQYIGPLRKEIEQVIKEEGWSKVAMTKMWKLDSFMKESQRINGVQLTSLSRKIMSDMTLSDGTFLPAGTFVAANVIGAHRDDSHYPDADKFDGFRFAKLREQSSEEGVKHQMVNTSPEYLAFGHGRHACPGRFFAVNELKAMMAYLILHYDVKAEIEGVRPENEYHRNQVGPNSKATVLLKKRKDA